MGYRLPKGGSVDRDTPVCFTFNGRELQGLAGDTLASALIANDVSIVARSFKYHRPRGIMGLAEEDPGGLVDLGTGSHAEPNVRATMMPLRDGLVARSVHCWPSVDFDLGAAFGLLKPFLGAGFYYKTFIWPNWKLFEPMIRRSAGLGKAPLLPDPDRYEHSSQHCDVLVCGAGPAGLELTRLLAAAGLTVVLAEQNGELGGSLLTRSVSIGDRPGNAWARAVANGLTDQPNVTVLLNATATGHYDGNWVAIHEHPPASGNGPARGRIWHVRPRQIVLATGAHERPLVFANNDRPGVMLAGAVAGYANRFGVAAGRRMVVFTNNSSAYSAAFDCHDRGMDVAAVVDSRPDIEPELAEACRQRGLALFAGTVVADVHGRRRVSGVTITGRATAQAQHLACDVLAVSGGFSPVIHLAAQGASRPVWDEMRQCFLADGLPSTMRCIGAANGRFTLSEALADAQSEARELLRELAPAGNAGPDLVRASARPDAVPYAHAGIGAFDEAARAGSCWVDLLHDVTVRDVQLAARENFRSVEHFKRYTTTGMAPDQGKTSGVVGLSILARETGRSISETGTTRFRPPYTPVPLGSLAGTARGRSYRPLRQLLLHDWHVAHGGRMEEYGGWLRPSVYAASGIDEKQAIAAEVRAVREGVGILDYSALGKIDVIGPDAGAFLDHVYMNDVSTLKLGRARYGLLLNDTGSIRDDGVFCRLAEQHFMITTTSGGAAAMANWLNDWHQCEWPQFDVVIQPFTTAWGTISLAGPQARAVLMQLDGDMDLSAEAFPHMSVRVGHLSGVGVRIMRVSFSGELTFEISAPVRSIPPLWQGLIEAGRAVGIRPYGLESLLVMRTEKGFLHVGSETDAATLPDDVGFGRLGSKKPMHFIGRRSLASAWAQGADREQLVGLEPVDARTLLQTGAQIVAGTQQRPSRAQGRVTTGCWSPTLDRPIALALLAGGRGRHGELVEVYQAGQRTKARVVPPCFLDAEGSRMNA